MHTEISINRIEIAENGDIVADGDLRLRCIEKTMHVANRAGVRWSAVITPGGTRICNWTFENVSSQHFVKCTMEAEQADEIEAAVLTEWRSRTSSWKSKQERSVT